MAGKLQLAVMYPLMNPAFCIAHPLASLSHGTMQYQEYLPALLMTSV